MSSIFFYSGNCPSHWQDRLAEKLKILQQTKSKVNSTNSQMSSSSSSLLSCDPAAKSNEKKRSRDMPFAEILSNLFSTNESTANDHEKLLYSEPVPKLIVLQKHEKFTREVAEYFDDQLGQNHTFSRVNLQPQMEHRMISLIADPFSEQVINSLLLLLISIIFLMNLFYSDDSNGINNIINYKSTSY